MIFTQIEFVLFLALTLVVAWSLRSLAWRNGFLLAVSYYFYAYWDFRFCGLLLISTVVDFSVAHAISRCDQAVWRKFWLAVSLIVNLGMLGFFKYCNFFIESATPLVRALGMEASTLNVVLPVGISFFTFQTLSYTIDVYRGKLKPAKSFWDFALYVAFFPQLVAGPIVRASILLPQLSQLPHLSRRRFYGGFQQLLRGAVKKVLIADRLGEMVDVVFAGAELYSSLTVWIAVVSYAGQIYYDFSGYSDMAIGIAKMLGYRFPANFRHPYLSKSISDFWRRWHITLSNWLRDYLYIPLGGSRGTAIHTHANLLITMTLGGLWHGAAMTFVLWGLLHGSALSLSRHWKHRLLRTPSWLGWLTTMVIVLMGWVLFRSPNLESALGVYERLWFPFLSVATAAKIVWLPPLTLLSIGLMVLEHAVWGTRFRRCMRLPWDAWYSPVATAILLWSLVLYPPQGFRPFVYFQF